MAPSPTARSLLWLALAAAIGVVGWFFVAGGTAAEAAATGAPGTEVPGGQPKEIVGDLRGPGDDAGPSAAEGPTRHPEARVTVTWRRVARLLRAAAEVPRVELCVGGAGRGLPGVIVAGTAANPRVPKPRGQQLVRFEVDGMAHYRVVRIGRDEGHVAVRRGMAIAVKGRVVDAAKRPLKSARVWLAGVQAETDEDGWFETSVLPVGDGMPLVVRAPGQAAFYRVLNGMQCETLPRKPIVMNRPATTLRVRFVGPGLIGEDAQFHLVPAKGRDTKWLAYPLFFSGVEPVRADADGVATFADVPRDARVHVLVHHPDCGNVLSQELRLDEDVVQCVMRGAPRGRVAGRVVDPGGRGVAGACVVSRSGGKQAGVHATGWLLPAIAYVPTGAIATTDATGEFSLPVEWSAAGRSQLTIEAAGRPGLAVDLRRGAGVPKRYTLPLASGAGGRPELALRAGQGLPGFVDVVVRGGEGVSKAFPWSTETDFVIPVGASGLLEVRVAVDGREVLAGTKVVDGSLDVVVAR